MLMSAPAHAGMRGGAGGGAEEGSRVLGFNYDTGERYLSVPDFLPEA